MLSNRARVKTKSTLGVGVSVGSGVAVGGRGVAVRVGGNGVGVRVGTLVAVGDGVALAVAVGGNGVDVFVGGTGVSVAVSTGVGVMVATGGRVGEGTGVGAATPQATIIPPDNTMPTATAMLRHDALNERWDRVPENADLTRITFPLRAVWDIIPARTGANYLVPKVGFEPT
jgi:hypothetical protein